MKIFTVENVTTLDKFIFEKYGATMPYATYKKLLRNKDVKVNGIRQNKNVSLCKGDEVCVYFDGVTPKLNVLYSSSDVIVLNKPSGITSEDFEVLVKSTYPTAKLCHRLDRNTSGIIIFSTNTIAEAEFLKAFKNRLIDKYYLAQIHGAFDKREGVLVDYLVKDEINAKVNISSSGKNGGVKIITEYKTLCVGEKTSLVKVKLISGKTHQIRAHLAFHGHFVIGDGKYGDNQLNKALKAKYQRLTAVEVIFNFNQTSPLYYLNGKSISLEKAPWQDMCE